jgi:capsid protein
LRAGKIEFRRLVEQTQVQMIVPRFCTPVWNRFISRAILTGELNERKDGYPCDWVTPAWESVNPKFDFEAEERNVRSGRVTPQR